MDDETLQRLIHEQTSQLRLLNSQLQEEINKRQLLEEKLQASEAKIRAVFEAMTDIVLVLNTRGNQIKDIEIIPTSSNLLYESGTDLIDKTVKEFFQDNTAKTWFQKFWEALDKKQALNFDYSLSMKGREAWFSVSISPISDNSVVWVARDITERKQAEEALRQSEERFRVLVESAPVGIFQTDLIGNCLFVNPRWLEITELSREEAIGIGWEKVLHPDECESVFTEWYDAAATGREFARECWFRTPQGKVKWVFVTAVLLRDGRRAITGYLGTVKDISVRRRAEEALQQLEARERKKAQALERAYSELKRTQAQLIQAEKMSSLGQMVVGIAHEINNPTSFIYGNINPAMEYTQDLLHLIELYRHHYPEPVAEIAEQLELIEPDFIADNNISSIKVELLPKIFDPFFTTKPVGCGTGLGLSISYQIVVDRHRGQLTCYSIPGAGTEFSIKLPIDQSATSHSTCLS